MVFLKRQRIVYDIERNARGGKEMYKKFRRTGAVALALAMAVTMLPGSISKAYTPGNYAYDDDYTLGYSGGVTVFRNGKTYPVANTNVTVFSNEDDRPFKSENGQAWDTENLTLTMPVKYTTKDGVAHDVESMLTNFDFIADPTAIDNSSNDGKLYVYGTTEAFSYQNGKMVANKYANHSITILSTSDMVNWTDEGFLDTQNLTNEPSDSDNKVGTKFTSGNTWAPSGLKIDGDGDGQDEYYIFYTNGGSTGYVMSDSPTGPWTDPLGGALCSGSLPNCSDCSTCFDPGVLADDKGNAYVYFGGLSRTSSRVVKIGFEPGTGEVYLDGDPVKLATHAFFEDNEINQFNGLYYYSYCSDFSGQALTKTASICVYVSDDPLNISFDPTKRPKGQELEPFTDDNGVYHHFLGTVLDNPSTIYGQSYNNHHHMQAFKDNTYIFYHSTVLNNSIHRDSKSYRNLHVDEITVDKDTDKISVTPSYEGAKQIEDYNPYKEFDGKDKTINATTTSYSAGVCSRRSDSRVYDGLSPMVLDEIDTGDWTKIQGVNFDKKAVKFEAEVASETDEGAIEVFLDDPTDAKNLVATVSVKNTGSQDSFEKISTDVKADISGKHDVYFVFRGTDYDVATWKFTNEEQLSAATTPGTPGTTNPGTTPGTKTTTPGTTTTPGATTPGTTATTPVVDTNKVYTVGSNTYKINADGTAVFAGAVKKKAKSVRIPATVTVEGKAYKVTEIAANAFKGCKKLTSVTIGKNITKIGANAFKNCKALKKITVKSTTLKSVGKSALKGTASKLTIKVPKKQLKAYKKIFKSKGQSKKARIK